MGTLAGFVARFGVSARNGIMRTAHFDCLVVRAVPSGT